MQIAVPIFEGFTALDAIGPYDVLSRIPGAEVVFCADEPGPKRTESAMVAVTADRALSELPAPDVVVVPGGYGNRRLLDPGSPYVSWLRDVHDGTTWTTSVCTGALMLAAAGILDGVDATTHWAARDSLAELGANPVAERVVERGKVMTAAGVSAGIDMALTLAARLTAPELAQAIQLGIEYDPAPPFDTGSTDKAPAELVALVRQAMDAEDRRTEELLAEAPGAGG
jgi:transcriptional regulator GlxA family with amidase domain